MVSELEKYYNIVERYHTESDDVGNYLFSRGIPYSLQTKTIFKDEIDLNWMVRFKPDHICVYTVKITTEEALVIKLTFPDVSIAEPKPESKIRLQDMARMVAKRTIR